MKFTKMYNVKNNRELKKVNDNVILEIKTRNTEDLLDINRQIWRLENAGYKVCILTPRGNIESKRCLKHYTKRHVNVEIPMKDGHIDKIALKAKLNNLKDMMSHKEDIEIPQFEKMYSAFDTPQPLEEKLSVEKVVYLDRLYTFSINGKLVNNYDYIKKLAKLYKIPLAETVGNSVIDPAFYPDNDECLLQYLDGFSEDTKRLFILKYRTKGDAIGSILQRYFGCTTGNEFEKFVYNLYCFNEFYKGEYSLIDHRVDAVQFRDDMLSLTGDYDKSEELLEEIAKRGFAFNLEGFPNLKQYSLEYYYDNTPNDDILD